MGLITLAQAKAFMQITTTVSDTIISEYIDLVSGEIDAYCNRNLGVNTYTETIKLGGSRYDESTDVGMQIGSNYPTYKLKNYPVQSVVSVVDNSVTVTNTNYAVDQNTGMLSLYTSINDAKRGVNTQYIAGYTTTTGSNFTVPQALQLVTKMGVKAMFENGGTAVAGSGNVKSKTIKDFSVSYGNDQTGLYVSDSNGELQKAYIVSNKTILDRFRDIGL